MPLLANGFVSLTDANGYVSLMVGAAEPSAWPQYFGIVATPNASIHTNFDLAVVFDPPGGPAGLSAPPVLELFTNLTLDTTTANYAVAQLNAHSRFVSVPSGFTPPPTNPTLGAATPVMLANVGTTDLKDFADSTYLTVQPTSPLSWPPNFGVLAQGYLESPDFFNLVLVYRPPSGNGVAVPVVVEQFVKVSLATIESAVAAPGNLIDVLTFEETPNPALSAFALTNYDASEALPSIALTSLFEGESAAWNALPDLLGSGPADTNFVVEIESDGSAFLRFGDGVNGEAPASGTAFTATYRIGNGTAGNVGAESLVYFAGDPRIASCANPIAAAGGVDPETNDQIRRRAPQAFRTQERAVTMDDYATVTEQGSSAIEDAAAALRWTGSWYTVFITAEPRTGANLSDSLRKSLTKYVNGYRLAGQDLLLEGPDYVSLDVQLTVCVEPDYFQRDVQQALLAAFATLFSSGAFELGQTVYLSRLYAVARTVAGVGTVAATVFQPQGVATDQYLLAGEIPLGPFQAARLENDPSLPNHGQLTLSMVGGK